ncbi:MAG: nitrous oxide reductase accessory protein NosL [Flavobacteriales bacterium]
MKNLIIGIAMSLLASSCSVGQPEIHYGHDECAHCRMNVMDKKFAAAISTVKGRSYVFDGPECMVPYVMTDAKVAEADVKTWYVTDFTHPGVLLDATKAYFLHSPKLRSPMNGNVAAFSTEGDRKAAEAEFPGEEMDWAGAKRLLAE